MPNSKDSTLNQRTDELRKTATDLGHNVQKIGHITKNIAQDTMGSLKENAGEYYEQGVAKAKNIEKDLESKIKENPLQALLVAIGLGFLIGMLFRRR